MIKYNLKCKNNHEFESWFSDSQDFEKLNKKRMLECIFCSSKEIKKSIMAPTVFSKALKENNNNFLNKRTIDEKKELLKIRNYIEKNFEFVGDKLSQKAREVYYDKKTKKSIYGTATLKEKEELADEGIDLLSVPWISKDN